jgi:hypothetical protein
VRSPRPCAPDARRPQAAGRPGRRHGGANGHSSHRRETVMRWIRCWRRWRLRRAAGQGQE